MSNALATRYAPLRRQPLKAAYLSFQLVTAFVRVPCWALLAIPRAWRPRKSWSWGRTMVLKIIRHLDAVSDKVGVFMASPSHHLALVPGAGFYGIWAEAVPQEFVVGKLQMWASVSAVSPVRLPGYWIHQSGSTIPVEASLMPGEKIVYHLHGGAYTRFSAHPTDIPAGFARDLLKHVERVHRTFAIEYRLSSTAPFEEAYPFPTALIDALTGYHYLVATLGIPPTDIIVAGDSAGGNLALALVRYLVEHSLPALPTPGALLLLSPWADLGTSHDVPGSSLSTCAHCDFVAPPCTAPPNLLAYSVRALAGPFGLGAAETNTYISPASMRITDREVRFTAFPRTLIMAGGAEILCDSIRTLYARMALDMGSEKVRYLEAADSVHNFLLLAEMQEPQRGETLAAIAEWVAETD
ncbi:Alpha/Beta hydrolase protein [Mycena capillaripes]|nr:Alpha/Beta hydrolase protein [Mycena capillaripes]